MLRKIKSPMKDKPEEIASIMNLILPKEEQLKTGDSFIKEYMNVDDKKLISVKPSAYNHLKNAFQGRVSFLKNMKDTNIVQNYIGEKIGNLQYFNVKPAYMSDYQTNVYNIAVRNDIQNRKEKDKLSIGWDNSIQASLAVFPNNLYGNKGFKKYIYIDDKKKGDKTIRKGEFKKKYVLHSDFKSLLLGKNNDETIKNISVYSSKYADIIETILNNPNKLCFIYCFNVYGSGLVLLSKFLELVGFKQANGYENTEGKRYALLTGDLSTKSYQQLVKNKFNSSENVNGKYIQVILGSNVISEGFSFHNIQQEFILSPRWNYSNISQAIYRGLRVGSHNDLKKIYKNSKINVDISRYVSIPNYNVYDVKDDEVKNNIDNVFSLDLYMYKISELKDVNINVIIRIIMETAFDCALNYHRNMVSEGKDFSQECNYMECKYECKDINMTEVINGLQLKDIDYSTYQLYYIYPEISIIRNKVEKILQTIDNIDLNFILNKLQNEFTEKEILLALGNLDLKNNKKINYNTFKRIYNKSPIKQITNIIENLFKNNFYICLKNILDHIDNKYNNFEIFTTLNEIIIRNIPIKNKYGYISYLREKQNLFYLVQNINDIKSVNCIYYNIYKTINFENNNFIDYIKKLYKKYFKVIINNLKNLKSQEEFEEYLKYIPIEKQELILEYVIIAYIKNNNQSKFITIILDYFINYYFKINDNIWVSTLLKDHSNIIKCYNTLNNKWNVCSDLEKEEINTFIKNKEINAKKSKLGYYGIYEADKKLRIIDTNVDTKEDKRKEIRGLVCGTGIYNKTKLINMFIFELPIEIPNDKFQNLNKTDMINLLKNSSKDSWKKSLLNLPKYKNKYNSYNDIIDSMDNITLRKSLYFSLPYTKGGINNKDNLCNLLKDLFIKNNALLFFTPQDKKVKQKSFNYYIDYIYSKNTDNKIPDIKIHTINKLINLNSSNKDKKDEINEDNTDQWLIFRQSKFVIIAGFSFDDNGFIKTINFNNRHIKDINDKKKILNLALDYIKKDKKISSKTLYINLNKTEPKYQSLLNEYSSWGFKISQNTNINTILYIN